MKKLLSMAFALAVFAADALAAAPRVVKNQVFANGFPDYPPLGELVEVPGGTGRISSLFLPIIQKAAADLKLQLEIRPEKDYLLALRKVRRGEVDIVMGAYHETEIYQGLELVYPSVLVNPVKLIMLPARAGEVKSLGDLKKLKGAAWKKEILSDYVAKQMKDYGLAPMDSFDELYQKLFAGEIDYIFAGHYHALFEAIRLGIRDNVSFARQNIWEMPVFLGISKESPHRKILAKYLREACKKEETAREMEERLAKAVADAEEKYKGVVPPAWAKISDNPQ